MRTTLKLILINLMALLAMDSQAKTTSENTYKVMFYNIQSQNKALSEEACQQMFKTFTFNIQGKAYHFNQQDNPSYSNHDAIAFLTLNDTQFLEVDNIRTKFHYNGQDYDFISNLFSITYTNPFILKGIIVNPYCKSAYLVVLDNPNALSSTTVKSISPTS